MRIVCTACKHCFYKGEHHDIAICKAYKNPKSVYPLKYSPMPLADNFPEYHFAIPEWCTKYKNYLGLG